MTDRYTVQNRSFERHNRLYRIGEVHDFSEWPEATRADEIAAAVGDGLIAIVVKETLSPGKVDPALPTPSGPRQKR